MARMMPARTSTTISSVSVKPRSRIRAFCMRAAHGARNTLSRVEGERAVGPHRREHREREPHEHDEPRPEAPQPGSAEPELRRPRAAFGHHLRRHHLHREHDRERQQYDLVNEAEHRDEVRDEIDRAERVGDDRREEGLRVPRRARVARGEVEREDLGLERPCALLEALDQRHVNPPPGCFRAAVLRPRYGRPSSQPLPFPSPMYLYTYAPSAPPAIGATQNSHSCSSAQPPANTATPVLRAGFTEVLVTGMLIRWMSVSARPIAMGAKPCGARLSVAPRMTTRNIAVITTSLTSAATIE